MSSDEARTLVKAINRRIRRDQIFEGGKAFGVDYTTWAICYPSTASAFNAAAEILTGRSGRFLPAAF